MILITFGLTIALLGLSIISLVISIIGPSRRICTTGYRELKHITTCHLDGSCALTSRAAASCYDLKQAAQEAVRMTRQVERVIEMIEVEH